jgi:hypothetical protein
MTLFVLLACGRLHFEEEAKQNGILLVHVASPKVAQCIPPARRPSLLCAVSRAEGGQFHFCDNFSTLSLE